MTVATQPTTRNDPYQITVTGSDPDATQYARAGLTVTGGIDLTITGLTVNDAANAANWSVQSNLQPGVVLYGDRPYTLPGIPAPLIGARWIRTANNSAKATANPLVTFTITAPATIAVAVDTRQATPPWIDASWTDTGTQLSDFEGGTTFRRFEIFTRPFAAGPVSLGPAATTTADMYVILVL